MYFTSKNETLATLENTFSTTKRLIVLNNNLTTESVNNRAIFIKNYKQTYVVKPTDTIENIAKRFATTKENLLKINGVTYLYPSQKIIISDE